MKTIPLISVKKVRKQEKKIRDKARGAYKPSDVKKLPKKYNWDDLMDYYGL